MVMDIFGIHWAGIDRIVYAPFALLFIVFIIKQHKNVIAAATQLVHKKYLAFIFAGFSTRKQRAKGILLSLGIVFVFLALLQPQWGKIEQTITQEGRDVLIVLDISRSMQAQDLKPTRLDFAKLKIRTLLSKLTCERVGLIVFSGSAFVLCPLTADHAAFLTFLDNVDTEIISSGTTAIDAALDKTLDVFKNMPTKKNKLVFLVTDGEDFSAQLNNAQEQAIQANLHLFALGVGTTAGAPIPKLDPTGKTIGHETDATGSVVLSVLNELMLQNMCSTLHGQYVRARYDDGDINTIVKTISSYEKEKFEDKHLSLFQDQYPWFLAVAWICLALEWIL